jgi:NADH-quinone oxidoreductase subunit C
MEDGTILTELKDRFPGLVLEASAPLGDPTAVIEKNGLVEIARFLRAEPQGFGLLLDLTCVDFRGERPRFELVYHFYSLARRSRLRIKARTGEEEAWVDSLTPLWKNAAWLEREVFDMFGIRFQGHPDLRRILMYDGFDGHPLRKDYPLRRRQPRLLVRE